MPSPFPCSPVIRELFVKENPDKKRIKIRLDWTMLLTFDSGFPFRVNFE